MADTAALLWPLLGFLSVAALASWWQAHTAKRELRDHGRQSSHDEAVFNERQDEIDRFKRSRERRAAVFAVLGLAIGLYLTLIT